jgi:hypothetical protein
MSEKYSTDELVNYLLPAEGLGFRLLLPPEVSDAIIAKLRTADNLCEVAKGLLDFIRGRFPKDFKSGGSGFTCSHHEALRKAIADFEGKEEK